MSFLRSRWVERPDGLEELPASQLAPGFRAGAVACGLKDGGETDVAVLACDEPGVTSALLLTANAAAAAPVRLCREECDAASIAAVAVNSGNANAATGEQGYRDAAAMRDAAADGLGIEPQRGRGCRDRRDRGAAGGRRRRRRGARGRGRPLAGWRRRAARGRS